MTVLSEDNARLSLGDGLTRGFAGPPVLKAEDMKVFVNGTLKVGGYSVSRVGSPEGSIVTMDVAPVVGAAVLRLRDPAPTQGAVYADGDAFDGISHQTVVDRLTMLIQGVLYRLSREISAALHSWGFDFGLWDMLAQQIEDPTDRHGQVLIGQALERRHHKDIAETIHSVRRRMRIGGFDVPVANVPYAWASDAGNKMAQGEPFAACYVDTPQGRSFSLRSTDAGEDVSAIARLYGGGGHRNAAGFKMPGGWEGETHATEARFYAKGRVIHKNPVTTDQEDGSKTIAVGFPVCTLTDFVGEEAGPAIAAALDKAGL